MCLAIIIDESVLCLNSGVPSQQTTVEDIYNIAGDLKDPLVDPLAKDVSLKEVSAVRQSAVKS